MIVAIKSFIFLLYFQHATALCSSPSRMHGSPKLVQPACLGFLLSLFHLDSSSSWGTSRSRFPPDSVLHGRATCESFVRNKLHNYPTGDARTTTFVRVATTTCQATQALDKARWRVFVGTSRAAQALEGQKVPPFGSDGSEMAS